MFKYMVAWYPAMHWQPIRGKISHLALGVTGIGLRSTSDTDQDKEDTEISHSINVKKANLNWTILFPLLSAKSSFQ